MRKVKITESKIRKLISNLLNESISDDEINQRIIGIKAQGLAKNPAFEALHNLTKELVSDQQMKNLIDASVSVKSHTGEVPVWNSHGFDHSDYWKFVVNVDPANRSSSGGGLAGSYTYPKITENFRTDQKPLNYILEDMRNSTLTPPTSYSGASITIADQDILTFLEDTSYVKSVADGHEAFAALLFAKYLDKNFTVTPSTQKGMDCISDDGTISIEVKGSQKPEPQTNFSGSLPKYSTNHFYLFLATDRSYIVRSDLLRRFYMLSQFNEEDQEESFYRRLVGDGSLAAPDSFPRLGTLRDFMITASPSDEAFDAIKTQSYSEFNEAINDPNTPQEIKVLYYKMLSEVESQTETLAATLIQSLFGFEGTERINPPDLSFLGLQVYLRPVLKGVKSQQDPSIPALTTGLGDGEERSQVYTQGGTLHPNYVTYIRSQVNSLVERIKSKYNYSSVNRSFKIKILAYIVTSVREKINQLAQQVYADIIATYDSNNVTADVLRSLKDEALEKNSEYKDSVAAHKADKAAREAAINALAASLSNWSTMTKVAKNKAIKDADIKKSYPIRKKKKRPTSGYRLILMLRDAEKTGTPISGTEFGEAFVESITAEIERLKEELTASIAEEASNLESTPMSTRLFEEKDTNLYQSILSDLQEASRQQRRKQLSNLDEQKLRELIRQTMRK